MLISEGKLTLFGSLRCASALRVCGLVLVWCGGFACSSFMAGNASAFELRTTPAEEGSPPPASLRSIPPAGDMKPASIPNALPLVDSAPPRPSHQGIFRSVGDALNEGIRGLKSGNPSGAVAPFTYAAEEGSIAAQWKLGRMYAEGEGVPRDDAKAYQLFSKIVDRRADESPDSPHARIVANAFVALGGYHLTGIPNSRVKKDPARASELFYYAASYFGDTEAQFRLGHLMAEGAAGTKNTASVQKDVHQGVKWLKLAAEKGHIPAQATLGKILFAGEGVPKQVPLGLMWMRVAADRAFNPKDAWVRELYSKAEQSATEDEVRLSENYTRKYTRGQLSVYPGN